MEQYQINLKKVKNENGPDLCYQENSGVKILEKDGCFFKDLAKTGELLPYEDWRLPVEERAKDLASRLSMEQIAGLMLHSPQQFIPGYNVPQLGGATYQGKSQAEAGVPVWAPTDQQEKYIGQDFIRHMLVSSVKDAESCARWTNQMQSLAEQAPYGVPMNISSDPRHGVDATAEFNSGAGGDISHWPSSIGMAATFDTELMERYGEIVAKEYRAMGIGTALSPQIDLSTEPRWGRFSGSFGESSAMCRDMGQAYCDGLQESSKDAEVEDGWGRESIIAMAKHWPGGGAVEAGRDAHFPCGKYSVYPGNNFDEHLIPFTEGVLKLKGKTGKAGAIMPYYTIPTEQDQENGENVGCSYNKYIITTLLREKYGYDELVCTDWDITSDEGPVGMAIGGKCWGVEKLTQAERCYKILIAGVDQFGGLMKIEPVREAYQMGVEERGEEWMQKRMRQSAVRILRNIFRLGLFENPYTNPEECKEVVGIAEFCEEGFQAQTQSVVLLKNRNQVLPLDKKAKVYIPLQYFPARRNWMMQQEPEKWADPVGGWLSKYFERVETPEEADAAICFMRMPKVGNGMMGMDNGYQNGEYLPISRQYRPYTAEYAREVSLAGGDPQEESANRSYKGKSVTTYNECDLDMVLDLREKMCGKPVIACVETEGPMVVHEFESAVDALLMCFDRIPQAVMEIISGKREPSAKLPFQIPTEMKEMELQKEDTPFDMKCHVDAEGNTYDFAFGMNWKGVMK